MGVSLSAEPGRPLLPLRTRVLRRLVRWLRPEAHNVLAVNLLLAAPDRGPRPIEAWPERRVLVLAPHADDEAIGCGGAMALHADAGAEVHVIVMTDGSRGDRRLDDPELDPANRAALRSLIVGMRRAEMAESARVLGAVSVNFLDQPDGSLAPSTACVDALRARLEQIRPELIYLPFAMDTHRDHWQTNRVLQAALLDAPSWAGDLRVRGYEVWSPLVANRVVDISAVRERKAAALAAHASQLRDRDYQHAIAGLNRYRTIHLPEGQAEAAEAFFESSLAGLLHLMRAIADVPRMRSGATSAVGAA